MNDKMIAIIDRPKSCLYCACFKDLDTTHGEYVTHGKCGITNERYYCNGSYVVEKDPIDNCPLKEIPDRMEIEGLYYSINDMRINECVCNAYNQCLDDILE